MKTNRRILLTIVIPVYNGEKYISDTIKNILDASAENIELLLVNDGSTDKSADICDKWSRQYSRVKYIYTQNSGIASARNKGIEMARGKYICFCDQDDEMVISVYEQLVCDMIQKSATIGICSTGRLINGEKSIYELVENGYYEKDNVLKKILFPILFRGYNYQFAEHKNYLYGTVWKCVFSVEFIKKHNLKFISFVDYEDDWIFVTHALSCSDKAVTISDVGYYWKVNLNSRSHQKKYICDIIRKLNDQDSYVYKYLNNGMLPKDILEEYTKIRLCEHYVDIIENALYADNKSVKSKNVSEIRHYLCDTNYKEQLKCQKRIQKTAFRRRIVCKVLQYAGINTAMCFNSLLRLCESGANKMQWLVKWERKGKLGNIRGLK